MECFLLILLLVGATYLKVRQQEILKKLHKEAHNAD